MEADQASTPPQVFTQVRIHHLITGRDVSPAAVEDAVHLSESKYCSVGAMIRRTAELTTTYEILEAAGERAEEPVLTGSEMR